MWRRPTLPKRQRGARTGTQAAGQNVVGLMSVFLPLNSVTVGQRVSLNLSFPDWDMQTCLSAAKQ